MSSGEERNLFVTPAPGSEDMGTFNPANLLRAGDQNPSVSNLRHPNRSETISAETVRNHVPANRVQSAQDEQQRGRNASRQALEEEKATGEPIIISDNELVIISDDDDDDNTPRVTFRFGQESPKKMRKTDVVRFVRREGGKILAFHARVTKATERRNDLKDRLIETMNVLTNPRNSGEYILKRYSDCWKAQLKKSEDILREYVETLNDMAESLKWRGEERIFRKNIITPAMERLEQGETGVKKMEKLIEHLREALD